MSKRSDIAEELWPDFPEQGVHTPLAEQAYRRGFDQGVAAACMAINSIVKGESRKGSFRMRGHLLLGMIMAQLGSWRDRVHKWRRKPHGAKPEFPEWLGQEEAR